MDIITLFNSFVNHLNRIFNSDTLFLHELESNITNSTNKLNLDTIKNILEFLDLKFKNSRERKSMYYVQQTRQRTLITSLGLLVFNKTYYKSKKKINGKFKYYSYLEDYLGISKWAKISLSAEVNLINNATDNGMSWACKNTIPNYIISRQTISAKIKSINYNYTEDIPKIDTPDVLYIEADEVHANLQSKNHNKKKRNNKIVPVILTHEGHVEEFVKQKRLKNSHYIASSILKTNLLWNETYKYLNQRYDLDKIKYLFISGDGASWIKGYDEAFPNAIYVLDPFHYQKALTYIFKNDIEMKKYADTCLREDRIDEFNLAVKFTINANLDQKDKINKMKKYLLNNIQGIKNQKHPMYKCHCSMEGHISNKYAKFLTSRPHAYCSDGLENATQLLTLKANNITLTEEMYYQFKTGAATYKKLNLKKFITNFRLQANEFNKNLSIFHTTYSIDNSSFSNKDNYRLDFFLSKRN